MKNRLLNYSRCIGLALLLSQGSHGEDLPAATQPQMAVYRWSAANPNGGAGGNIAFAQWMGRPLVWAEDFAPLENWENIEGGDWQLGEWSEWKKTKTGRRLILSIPLLPGGWDLRGPKTGAGAGQPVSLNAGAKGEFNSHFRKLAENLVRFDLGDTILRLGWEFNGGWYSWRASANPEAYAEYWRQIVATMRGVPGAQGLKFCWNPAQGWQQFAAERAWPGDETVDFVGVDLYDDSWAANTYPFPEGASATENEMRQEKVWNEVLLSGDHGLKFWSDFARKHRKPLAIPEWGVDKREDKHGGLDDPGFVREMHRFISNPTNNVVVHCYFDVQAGDGHHQLSPGRQGTETTEFPKSAAMLKGLFGVLPPQR